MSTAESKYRMFHGKHPKRATTVNYPDPADLVRLGRAVAIEYECDKRNGGGDGTKAVYRHRFETPCDLMIHTGKDGGHWLFVHGRKLKTTEAGIEN